MLEYILPTKQHTYKLGQKLAKNLESKPQLVFIHGNLGAGKTTLCASIIQELLHTETPIPSPTYNYVNYYDNKIPIYHFDLYRISHEQDLYELGLLELLTQENSLRLVEWPEQGGSLIPPADISFHLQIKKDQRILRILPG